jgi:hypothetical protein
MAKAGSSLLALSAGISAASVTVARARATPPMKRVRKEAREGNKKGISIDVAMKSLSR